MMRAAPLLAVFTSFVVGSASGEGSALFDPTPEDIEQILLNYPLDQVVVEEGCAEYGTARAKPGCYKAEKSVIGRFGDATFMVTLRQCARPDVDCRAMSFEMWRRPASSERDPSFYAEANDWNRSRWMAKVFGDPGWPRLIMHVPVEGGITQAALERYVRIWYSAATEAAERFPQR